MCPKSSVMLTYRNNLISYECNEFLIWLYANVLLIFKSCMMFYSCSLLLSFRLGLIYVSLPIIPHLHIFISFTKLYSSNRFSLNVHYSLFYKLKKGIWNKSLELSKKHNVHVFLLNHNNKIQKKCGNKLPTLSLLYF